MTKSMVAAAAAMPTIPKLLGEGGKLYRKEISRCFRLGFDLLMIVRQSVSEFFYLSGTFLVWHDKERDRFWCF